ncbi:MAG: hypothetical protein GY868_12040 [Deltaproteobacteria bacterium]|nr:hypothetical protein [Deltaproteobacteria bacterium]
MSKLIIPKVNEQEKALFSKFGISLVEKLSEKVFFDAVVNYLNSHNVLNLATCKNNEPRCTTVEYYNSGLRVFLMCEGGGKIVNIKKNSLVSYTVNDAYEPAEDFFSACGLQVWGQASVFRKNDQPERAQEIMSHYRNREGLARQGLDGALDGVNFNMVTIEPVRIRYHNYRMGYRRVMWIGGDESGVEI